MSLTKLASLGAQALANTCKCPPQRTKASEARDFTDIISPVVVSATLLGHPVMRHEPFRLIRPVGNSSDRLTVKIGLKLSQIIGVDMKRQIMVITVRHNPEPCCSHRSVLQYSTYKIVCVSSSGSLCFNDSPLDDVSLASTTQGQRSSFTSGHYAFAKEKVACLFFTTSKCVPIERLF